MLPPWSPARARTTILCRRSAGRHVVPTFPTSPDFWEGVWPFCAILARLRLRQDPAEACDRQGAIIRSTRRAKVSRLQLTAGFSKHVHRPWEECDAFRRFPDRGTASLARYLPPL